MKKVFLVIIAAALMLSLCMINSFAASSVKHVSRDQVVIEEDNKDVAKLGGNSDPTDVDVAEYTGKTLRIWGWLGTVSPIAGFGYTINGGEIVTGDFAVTAGQDVIDAVALYFSDQSSFNEGYLYFYGDGYQNHFSQGGWW